MTVRRRVLVDSHLCEGHALCLDTAPEVFDLSDDDVATCTERPADGLWNQVQAAVDACPRGAIVVVEDKSAHSPTSSEFSTERPARP